MKNTKKCIFAGLLLMHSLLSACMATPAIKKPDWTYEIVKGKEISQRQYLLVKNAGTEHETRFVVRSECSKPHHAEGAYGSCTHTVTEMQSSKPFTVTTGEDVVQVGFTWDQPTILATIEYGCCAGPDVASFYSEGGKYLGHTERYRMSDCVNYQNAIARTYDFRNATRFEKKIYMLVLPEPPTNSYQILVFDGKQQPYAIPISIEIPNWDDCDLWYVDNFIAYGDRQDITLEMQGNFCTKSTGPDRVKFSCLPSEGSFRCQIRQ